MQRRSRSAGAGQACYHSLVVRDARGQGVRELRVTEGTLALTGPLTGQGEREMRVVVRGVQGHGLRELPPRPGGAPGHEQGSAERLADRRLVGLEELRATEDQGSGMGVPVVEHRASLRIQLVRRCRLFVPAIQSGCHASPPSAVWYTTLPSQGPGNN